MRQASFSLASTSKLSNKQALATTQQNNAINEFLEDTYTDALVVVKDNKIIGKGYNQREQLNDPTAHAEILAITAAANSIGDWRLKIFAWDYANYNS